MSELLDQLKRRRTFAIISHPDAGKTTLTEKLLLFGGAIQMAGTVKGRKAARHATSDWMEMEKERGISVTTSVMKFNYLGYAVNLLDKSATRERFANLGRVDALFNIAGGFAMGDTAFDPDSGWAGNRASSSRVSIARLIP